MTVVSVRMVVIGVRITVTPAVGMTGAGGHGVIVAVDHAGRSLCAGEWEAVEARAEALSNGTREDCYALMGGRGEVPAAAQRRVSDYSDQSSSETDPPETTTWRVCATSSTQRV